jgi:hypothetical protein
MEQPTGYPQQPQIIVVKPTKSVGVAILLSFLFGPLGMLYSTIAGGLIMFVVTGISFILTAGVGLFITWPIGIIWAAVAANSHNNRI